MAARLPSAARPLLRPPRPPTRSVGRRAACGRPAACEPAARAGRRLRAAGDQELEFQRHFSSHRVEISAGGARAASLPHVGSAGVAKGTRGGACRQAGSHSAGGSCSSCARGRPDLWA